MTKRTYIVLGLLILAMGLVLGYIYSEITQTCDIFDVKTSVAEAYDRIAEVDSSSSL